MLFSLALIMIMGFSLSGIFNRLHLPGLLGMILTGIVLGPFTLNLISEDILNISTELRQIALIIILTRAGLAIDIKDLKKWEDQQCSCALCLPLSKFWQSCASHPYS